MNCTQRLNFIHLLAGELKEYDREAASRAYARLCGQADTELARGRLESLRRDFRIYYITSEYQGVGSHVVEINEILNNCKNNNIMMQRLSRGRLTWSTAPVLWNTLPSHLRHAAQNSTSLPTSDSCILCLSKKLLSHIFRISFPP
jgi:hypothetical protein